MALRKYGIVEEASYANCAATEPDWYQDVSKLSASLNSEPILKTTGSRMQKKARAGTVKPTASTETDVDLQRFAYYMKAFYDRYNYTDDTTGPSEKHIHEFFGGENSKLPSFKGWATFDYVQKVLAGLVLDEMKLEVNDEFMSCAGEWIYKNQKIVDLNPDEFEEIELAGNDIPLMSYDISLELDGDVPPGIIKSLNFEGKNNHNVDNTIGLGSRFPQRKAAAQKREITLSFVSTMEKETLDLIKLAEHGDDTDTPSDCKVYRIPLKIIFEVCEDPTNKMEMYFPDCLFAVEYEASESEEIEVTFNLTAMGTGKVERLDGSEVITDMYATLYNDMPEIVAK